MMCQPMAVKLFPAVITLNGSCFNVTALDALIIDCQPVINQM